MTTAIPITFTAYSDNEEGDREVTLPARWCICGHCEGNGTSSAYLGAITQSDREAGGAWEDPDEFEGYMRGDYDRPCDRCEGTGKVQEVDRDRCAPADLAAWELHCQVEREIRAEERAERRAGC